MLSSETGGGEKTNESFLGISLKILEFLGIHRYGNDYL